MQPLKSLYWETHRMLFTLRRLVLGVFVMLLASCAALSPPGSKTYTISQAQLLELITQKFPFNERVAELLDLQAIAPRIKLLPDTNRIATELDLNLSERFLRSTFKGSLAMDYGLRVEPSDNSVRLTDVKVSNLQFSGVPAMYQPFVNGLGPVLAERLLKDFTLHKISPADLAAADGWGYAPGGFQVTQQGLSISLVPKKAL
jgi:hypothetical protein